MLGRAIFGVWCMVACALLTQAAFDPLYASNTPLDASTLSLDSWPQPAEFAAQATDAYLRHQEEAFAVLTVTGGTDPCAPTGDLNPCKNDAVCVTTSTAGSGTYTCFCTSSFAGTNCDIPLAGQDMLKFVGPPNGLFNFETDITSTPLQGVALVQGLVNAGTLIRLNITSQLVAPSKLMGPSVASNLNAVITYPSLQTVSIICTFADTCQEILNRLTFQPSGGVSGTTVNIVQLTAEDFNAGANGALSGAPKHTASLLLRVKFIDPSSSTILTAPSLIGPATLAALPGIAVTLADYSVSVPDIYTGLKLDAVKITLTAVQGSVLTPTTADFVKTVSDSGSLADINAYLAMSFYRGGTTGTDTLTFVIEDQFNSTTVVLPVVNGALNQAPIITYNGVVGLGSQSTIFTVNGFVITDDAVAGASLDVTITADKGTLTLNPAATAAQFTTSVTTSGTLAAINLAIKNLRYTQQTSLNLGLATITVIVNDNGATGFGGPKIGRGSVAVTVNVAHSLPQQMDSPSVSSITPTTAQVSWSPISSSSPLYSDIPSYQYTLQYALLGTNGVLGAFTDVYNGPLTTFALTGLAPNSIYELRVRATGTAGAGPFSVPFVATTSFVSCPLANTPCGVFTTPYAVPVAVTPVFGVATETSIPVTWTAVTGNAAAGTSPATQYILTFSVSGGGCRVGLVASQCSGSYIVTGTGYNIVGLASGTTYTIGLQAVNPAGKSAVTTGQKSTLFSAPIITSFSIANGVGETDSNLYHVGDVYTIQFDSRISATVGDNFIPSGLTFLQDGTPINVGSISCTWTSIDIVNLKSTLSCKVLSLTGAGTITLGALTVKPSGSINIVAFGGTLPSTATSPPLTGSFGVSIFQPTITVVQPTPDAHEFTPYSLAGFFTANAATDGSVNINTVYSARLSVSLGGGALQIGGTGATQAVLTKDGTIAQINAWLSTITHIGASGYVGRASVALALFPTNPASTTPVAQAAGQFNIVPTNSAPILVVAGGATTFTVNADANTNVPLTITVTDVDATRYATRPLKVTIQASGTASIVFSTPAALAGDLSFTSLPAVATNLISFSGSLVSINAALTHVQVIGRLSTNPFILTYTVDDLDNGGTGFGAGLQTQQIFTVTVACTGALPVAIQSAVFTDSYGGFLLKLDRYVDYTAPGFLCSALFSASTLALFAAAPSSSIPSCSFLDHRTISVSFGSGATVLPNQALTTLASSTILRRCSTAAVAASLPFSISRPAGTGTLIPVVSLNGPTYIAQCASAANTYTYTALATSGLGGRPAAYVWSISGDVSDFPPTVVKTNGDLVLPGNFLPSGGIATISVSVTNFLGETSISTLKVQRLTVLAPELSGPSALTVSPQSGFFIEYHAGLPACTTQTGVLSFRWTVQPAPLLSLDTNSETSSILNVLPGTLQPGQTYTFTLTASLFGVAGSQVTAQTVVTVLDFPLLALLIGGQSRSVGASQPIVLDASPSQLPVKRTGGATYAWKCTTLAGGDCINKQGQVLIGSNDAVQTNPKLTIAANALALGQYTFTVTVGVILNGVQQTSVASQTINVVAGTPLAVSLVITQGLIPGVSQVEVNTHSQVVIRTTQAYPTSLYTYRWSITGGNLASPLTTQITQRSAFTLNPNQIHFFDDGATYTVTLTVSLTSNPSTTSTSTISFYVNSAPSGGSLLASRATGEAGVTAFTFTATGFTDLENGVPLSYQFYYNDKDGLPSALGPESTDPTFTTVLPQGTGFTSIRTVGVKVLDRNRGYLTAVKDVVVTPMLTFTNTQFMNQFIGKVIGQSPLFVVQTAGLYAAVLNANVAGTLPGQDQSQIRAQLLASVAANVGGIPPSVALSTLNAILGDRNIRQAAILTQVLNVLLTIQNRIAQDPAQTDDLNLENFLFQIYANILDSNTAVTTTPAALIIGGRRRLLATTNGQNTQICSTPECQDAAANQQAALNGVIAGMKSVEARLVDVGDYQTREKDTLSLTVYRDDPRTAQSSTVALVNPDGSLIAVGGVTVSANYLTGFTGPSDGFVDFQSIILSGPDTNLNPYEPLETTKDSTIFVTAPVMYFDITDSSSAHIAGLNYANNGIRVILPLTGSGCATIPTGYTCALQCVSWSNQNAFTPANVQTVSNNGTHVFCRPLNTPILISVLSVGTKLPDSSTGPTRSSTGAGPNSSTGPVAASSTGPAAVSSTGPSGSTAVAVSSTGAASVSSTGAAAVSSTGASGSTGVAPVSSTGTGAGAVSSTGAASTGPAPTDSSTGIVPVPDSSTGSSVASTGTVAPSSSGAAAASYGVALVDFLTRFNSSRPVPTGHDLDPELVTDISAATGLPATRIVVTHKLTQGCDASNVCYGPTDVHVELHPTGATDPEAERAGKVLTDQINCKPGVLGTLSLLQCDTADTIMAKPVNLLFPDEAIIRGSANFTSGIGVIDVPAEGYGHARDGNIGYYVLGAILAALVLVALLYFILHKAPPPPEVVVERDEEEPMVAAKPKPSPSEERAAKKAAAAAAASAAAAAAAEEAEAARAAEAAEAARAAEAASVPDDAGQMDYKSVFALKHNVLEKPDDSSAAPVDDNDVHFVLHQ